MMTCNITIQDQNVIVIPQRLDPILGYYKAYKDVNNKRICMIPDPKGVFYLRIKSCEGKDPRAVFQNVILVNAIKSNLGPGIGGKIRVDKNENGVLHIYAG